MENLTQSELDERVALIKRFKVLLKQQRDKFQEYLTVLEKQETSIESENADVLLAHTELEQEVVSGIMNLQKVIVPMSEIYKQKNAGSVASNEREDVNSLQSDLEDLKNKVLVQNEKNRSLLKTHIGQLRGQIASFKNPYKNIRSVYAEKQTMGNLIAVEA